MLAFRLFKKKATLGEFRKLKKYFQHSRSKQQEYNPYIEFRMKMLTQIAMKLSPPSKEFDELKQQFGEFTLQFLPLSSTELLHINASEAF